MRLFFALCAILGSSTALAALQTNHLLTPTGGQHELTVTPSYTNNETELVQPNKDSNELSIKTLGIELGYSYGLSDDHTVGASLLYASDTISTENYISATDASTSASADVSGLRGITLQYQGKRFFEPVHLYYSAAYQMAIEEPAPDKTAYIQNAILLTAGAFHQFESSSVVGLTMKYQMNQNGTYTDATDTDQTLSGGNSLTTTLFYEFAHDLRPQIAFIHKADYTSSIQPEGGTEAKTAGNSVYGPRLSMKYAFTPAFEMIPSLTYFLLDNKEKGAAEYDTYNLYQLNIAGRFTF